MPPHQPKFPKRKVRLDCGQYILRTITVEDATDRWAHWMEDPEASDMLNAPRKAMTREDLVAYIRGFDQRTRILIGIFEKASGLLLGFLRNDVDFATGQFLVSMIIGEPDYRHSGVTNAVTIPFRDYFFETLGMKVMMATALAHNRPIIHYLYSTGWTLDRTLERHIKSHLDGRMFDLCFFSQTRDGYRAWKKAKLEGDQGGAPSQSK
jgi:RimJ/RimL family protein N-acetyltransferase